MKATVAAISLMILPVTAEAACRTEHMAGNWRTFIHITGPEDNLATWCKTTLDQDGRQLGGPRNCGLGDSIGLSLSNLRVRPGCLIGGDLRLEFLESQETIAECQFQASMARDRHTVSGIAGCDQAAVASFTMVRR
jgi:hypothetical protein